MISAKRLHADLQVDFIPRRHWPAAGLLLAVIALSALAWQGWAALRESEVLQRQRAGLAQLQRQAGKALQDSMLPADVKRHRQIDLLAAYLATPWDRLLGLFEQHASLQVILLRLESDAATGHVEISGRAASSWVLADYVIALEADPRLRGVLLQHHEAMRNEPTAPVNFKLSANWSQAAGVQAVAVAPLQAEVQP